MSLDVPNMTHAATAPAAFSDFLSTSFSFSFALCSRNFIYNTVGPCCDPELCGEDPSLGSLRRRPESQSFGAGSLGNRLKTNIFEALRSIGIPCRQNCTMRCAVAVAASLPGQRSTALGSDQMKLIYSGAIPAFHQTTTSIPGRCISRTKCYCSRSEMTQPATLALVH